MNDKAVTIKGTIYKNKDFLFEAYFKYFVLLVHCVYTDTQEWREKAVV